MMGPSDPLGWAKLPKSREAITAVHELAVKDRRFRAIWTQLVKEGVATSGGQPLQVWDGTQWVKL